jgi:hypothetical protein
MRTAMTGINAFALLAAIATLGVLGNASVSWAQFGGGPFGGNVERCSLSGVNPVDHPNIFNDPAVARSYGFVQVNGTWQVSPSLCGRGRSRAQAAPAAGAPKAAPASAKAAPASTKASAKAASASAKGDSQIASDGKCWVNTGGTTFRWDDCKK